MTQPLARLAAVEWLALAAAPAFAVMAVLSAGSGGGGAAMVCGAGQGLSALGGMAPMYLLMSAVHAGPWLKLLARRGVGP